MREAEKQGMGKEERKIGGREFQDGVSSSIVYQWFGRMKRMRERA